LEGAAVGQQRPRSKAGTSYTVSLSCLLVYVECNDRMISKDRTEMDGLESCEALPGCMIGGAEENHENKSRIIFPLNGIMSYPCICLIACHIHGTMYRVASICFCIFQRCTSHRTMYMTCY